MYLALLASSEGAAGAPVSPFEVNPGLIIWTWFVFGVLFLLLKKYAWPAILSVTEEREETIRKHLAEAEQAHAKAQALLAEQQKLLGESRGQAQAIMAEAKSAAEKERAVAVQKTRDEQDAAAGPGAARNRRRGREGPAGTPPRGGGPVAGRGVEADRRAARQPRPTRRS